MDTNEMIALLLPPNGCYKCSDTRKEIAEELARRAAAQPVAWATPSLLVTLSAVEKNHLTNPDRRTRGGEFESAAADAERYSVPLYAAPPAQAEPQEGDLLHTMMEWARTEEGRKRLADQYRPRLFACAKRVADPTNELAACKHWCGDIEHCQPIASAPAQAEPQPEPPADALVEALRAGRQADADGVMVIVSRQACEEAADRIAALTAEVDEDNAEIASLCEAAERAESALAAANERERGLREALQAAADSMTCRDDAAHYCPNCDRSSYKARDDARAALARKEGE